jgi:hypothetical protein
MSYVLSTAISGSLLELTSTVLEPAVERVLDPGLSLA